VRRALEHTAVNITGQSAHSVGHGVLQVDTALQYLVAGASQPAADVQTRYSVKTSCGGVSGRGIYLRQPYQVTGVSASATVFVTPHIHEDVPSQAKIGYEKKVAVSCTAAWVQVPTHLLLANAARSFSVEIDLEALAEGVHYTEIVAVDGDGDAASPPVLFRVPVTVIKPSIVPADGQFRIARTALAFTPGHIDRQFISVPEGSTWATIRLQTGAFDGSRRFLMHLVQLRPGLSAQDGQWKRYVVSGGLESHVFHVKVVGGFTLEVCLAQFWMSLGDSSLDLSVEFHSVSAPNSISITGAAGETQVDVTAAFRAVNLEPSGQLKQWQQSVRPEANPVIRPLLDVRDVLPEGRRIFEMQLV